VRIHIATDHAAYDLKQFLVKELTELGHEVVDHGAEAYDAADDYPPFMFACAEATASDPGSLGIVLGGSGNGEAIAANKVRGVRAALAWNVELARLAREHNNANVVAVGGRQHSVDEASEIVRAFLDTPFSEDPRHQRRIDMLTAYEEAARG